MCGDVLEDPSDLNMYASLSYGLSPPGLSAFWSCSLKRQLGRDYLAVIVDESQSIKAERLSRQGHSSGALKQETYHMAQCAVY